MAQGLFPDCKKNKINAINFKRKNKKGKHENALLKYDR